MNKRIIVVAFFVIFTYFICLLFSRHCQGYPQYKYNQQTEDIDVRFEEIYVQKNFDYCIRVFRDTTTRIDYLFVEQNGGVGLCQLEHKIALFRLDR